MKGLNERIKEAAELIANSDHLVIFTGAGISTESGIPDYRGPNGVWTRRDKGLPPPKPKVPWKQRKPNQGHIVIKKLQDMGLMKFLISQNVDNLHLMSGIKEDLIGEFHGNSELMRCMECGTTYQKSEIWDDNKWGPGYLTSKVRKGQPSCPECDGRLVSTVVNFGDPIPDGVMENSVKHSQKCDVFLVVGSSLSVTPASYMPKYALKNNADLIIINKQPTPMDNKASVLFHESAGDVLVKILDKVEEINKQ
ncbi:MAG: hypothetical protein GF364_07530 [Candidatus Lokiarchaeota archaeon]|nr:hypothetical protein [Candidatus Lokiarchaeota archaeon]